MAKRRKEKEEKEDKIRPTQLDIALHGQQNVVRFDVSMNDALGVQML